MDAAAVKWNLDRVQSPDIASPFASSYGNVAGTTVEGRDVVYQLNEPFSPLPNIFGGVLAIMMCPSSVQGDDFTPVGSGPYKFVSWERNSKIVLEAFDEYVNVHPLVKNPGAPYVKNLIIKVIPEGVARMAALKTGEVDFAEPSLPDAADLDADPNYKVYTAPLSGQQGYTGVTYRIPPFDDVRARRAVGYAIDRNACADYGFQGLSKATHPQSHPVCLAKIRSFVSSGVLLMIRTKPDLFLRNSVMAQITP
jgi:peptide/nickel transport system substrate-binding protein